MIPTNDIWTIRPESVKAIADVVCELDASQIAELTRRVAERQAALDDAVASFSIEAAGPVDEAARRGLPVRNMNGIARIPLRGVITKGASIYSELFGGSSTIATKLAVRAARMDKDIKVIALMVDSPGGSVDGIVELADEVYAARQNKRVVVQADGMMASAAYWVGSQGDELYASRTDLIGSLGVRQTLYDMSKAFSDEGIKPIVVDTSPEDRPYKSAGEMGTEITDKQIADFQRIVDAFGNEFRSAIMRGRGMSEDQVDAVFDGRVWLGEEAQSLGLINGIQTGEVTLSALRNEIMQEEEMMRQRRAAIRDRIDNLAS